MFYDLQGGILAEEVRVQAPPLTVPVGIPTSEDRTAWLAGGLVGIAVERELAEGLALRVASPLLDGHYTSTRLRSAGRPTVTSSSVVVRAVLAPTLELRLLF